MGELGELGGKHAGYVSALLDLGDLVGAVLHALAALGCSDALEAAGEERDPQEARIATEAGRERPDGGAVLRRAGDTASARGVPEGDAREALRGLAELVDLARGRAAGGGERAAKWVRARAGGGSGGGRLRRRKVDEAQDRLGRGRSGGVVAPALRGESSEDRERLAGRVEALRPRCQGGVRLAGGQGIELAGVEPLEELVLEAEARFVALPREGKLAVLAMQEEMPLRDVEEAEIQTGEVSGASLPGCREEKGGVVLTENHAGL